MNQSSLLDLLIEIEEERKDLRKLEFTEEEIEGYFDFYIENYFDVRNIIVKGNN